MKIPYVGSKAKTPVAEAPTLAEKRTEQAKAGYADSTRPADAQLKAIGIDPSDKLGPANLGKSKIIDVLGGAQFAEFKAVQVPGRVAWVNFALARKMGFDVPPGNKMTPEFEKQLIEALSYRAVRDGEDTGDAKVITMHADKYGGTNIGNKKGAARAGFLPWGNLNIKGVGLTPLFVPGGDFTHSHGGAPMREGLLEALWGEVNGNLFAAGSTQILAVIDNNDFTQFPSGGREKRALIVRAGQQFRPAHLLNGSTANKNAAKQFARAAAETGDLATRQYKGKTVPDLEQTQKNIIGKHARTAAEQFRWRILHGALSTSNMEIGGAQLDLATETPQLRTARVKVLDFLQHFGAEHRDRIKQIDLVFTAMQSSVSKDDKTAMNLKPVAVGKEFEFAYHQQLEIQMMKAAGLKEDAALAIQLANPQLARTFTGSLLEIAALENKGIVNVDKQTADGASVADVFGALGALPERYFAGSADLVADIRELMKPVFDGGSPSKNAANKSTFESATTKLAADYDALMTAVGEHAAAIYDNPAAMKRSISQRAAFENVPLTELFRAKLNDRFMYAVDDYDAGKDMRVLTEAIDKTAAVSVRNVDGLIGQGAASRMGDGGVELGLRTIDGIDYSVRAWDGGQRRLHLEMPVTGDRHKGYDLGTLPGSPHLSRNQVENMSYRFSTDGWKTYQEAPARLSTDDAGQRTITFDIPTLGSDVGQLEGLFHVTDGGFWLKDGSSNFRGYTYAVPDNAELADISSRLDD